MLVNTINKVKLTIPKNGNREIYLSIFCRSKRIYQISIYKYA